MKYAGAFAIFAVALIFWAITLQGWGWLLLWPALSFALASFAYGGIGPLIFAKRLDGTLPPHTYFIMGPFIALNTLIWHTQRLLSREPASNQITPGLYVGRRPFQGELPPDVRHVVDLTSEFAEPRAVRTHCNYISLPVLDATAPDATAVRKLLEQLATSSDPILIHCAQGHGRSGLIAGALLLHQGLAKTPAEAESLLRQARPGIRLSPRQRHLLAQFANNEALIAS